MSLQELCIKVIVDEFERYYLAFSTTDDPNLKRKFEFLQRVYSYQIASQLYDSDKLQTNYIDLLVNKYLKMLDTEWFKDCPWKTVTEKFAEVGPNVQKIHFQEFHEERPWLDVIYHLTNLQVLSFPLGCNDETLKCFAQFCPNIVEIDMSFSAVTDKGIRYLCRKENGKPLCPKLRKLIIGLSNVKEEGVKYLIQNLRSLEETDYKDLPKILFSIHKNDFSALNTVEPYKLTSLNFLHLHHEPDYTDILKVCLSVCPCLKFLSCPVSNKQHLDLLSSPLELEKLHLESHSDSKIDITNVLKMSGKKLTNLKVSLCTLSVSSLCQSCPCLKQLHLDQATLKNDGNITPLFKYLETCIFDYTTYDIATIKSIPFLLKYSHKLEHISFQNCDLFSGELKTEILGCCEYCPIKRVDFSDCVVDVNFVKDVLLNFHSLKLFNLYNCELNCDEELELLSIAQILPNNPEINFSDPVSLSDFEGNSSSYEFDDSDSYYDDDDDGDYDSADDIDEDMFF